MPIVPKTRPKYVLIKVTKILINIVNGENFLIEAATSVKLARNAGMSSSVPVLLSGLEPQRAEPQIPGEKGPEIAPASVARARGDAPFLTRKLGHYVKLDRAERDAIAKALSLDVRQVRRRTILLARGAIPTKLAIMLDGWACRYKVAANGRRQIVAFYLPGDVCDFSIFMAPEIDSTIELIDRARVAGLSRGQLATLSRSQPRVVRALWRDAQSAASIQREWLVSIAQRSAIERTAHLLSEFMTRLDAVGLVEPSGECALPITQADFGDACGLTAEHTNRCLRELRSAGIATWRNGILAVPDRARLAGVCHFDPAYLQLKPLADDRVLMF